MAEFVIEYCMMEVKQLTFSLQDRINFALLIHNQLFCCFWLCLLNYHRVVLRHQIAVELSSNGYEVKYILINYIEVDLN